MRNQSDQGGQRVSTLQEGATDTQTDGVLQLRLDNAKLMRSEAALRAKGSSLEEALKALEARLSEYEAQAMAQHAALEHGKHQVRGRAAFGRSKGRLSTSALLPKCCTHDQTIQHNCESDKQVVLIWHTHSSIRFLKSPSCRLCISSAHCLHTIGLPTHQQ